MSFDLTNKNISDTYQNLLQKTGSNNQLFDLLGNPVTDLTIQGALIAESYIVSQSTIVFSSGSTAFGNSSDDTHKFTGESTNHYVSAFKEKMDGDHYVDKETGKTDHTHTVSPARDTTTDQAVTGL